MSLQPLDELPVQRSPMAPIVALCDVSINEGSAFVLADDGDEESKRGQFVLDLVPVTHAPKYGSTGATAPC